MHYAEDYKAITWLDGTVSFDQLIMSAMVQKKDMVFQEPFASSSTDLSAGK